MTPYLIAAAELLIAIALLWLAREIRALRRDAGQSDILLEQRGRLIELRDTLESRAAVVALEVGQSSRTGAIVLLADAPGLENWRLN